MTPQQLLYGIGIGALILLWSAMKFFSFEPFGFLFGKNVLENKRKERRRYGWPEEDEHEKRMNAIIDEEVAKRKRAGNDEPFSDCRGKLSRLTMSSCATD